MAALYALRFFMSRALIIFLLCGIVCASESQGREGLPATGRSGDFLTRVNTANSSTILHENASGHDQSLQNMSVQASWVPAPNTCHAVDHKLCIFPFNYNGVTHGQCTTDHYSWFGGWWHGSKRWCATAVNSDFEMTSWHYCEHSCHHFDCATTGGHKCHFPFRLSSGTAELNQCAPIEGSDKTWCPLITKIDGSAYEDGCPDVVPLWFTLLSMFKKWQINCKRLDGPQNNWGMCEKSCR